jgi:hypothetical protein
MMLVWSEAVTCAPNVLRIVLIVMIPYQFDGTLAPCQIYSMMVALTYNSRCVLMLLAICEYGRREGSDGLNPAECRHLDSDLNTTA